MGPGRVSGAAELGARMCGTKWRHLPPLQAPHCSTPSLSQPGDQLRIQICSPGTRAIPTPRRALEQIGVGAAQLPATEPSHRAQPRSPDVSRRSDAGRGRVAHGGRVEEERAPPSLTCVPLIKAEQRHFPPILCLCVWEKVWGPCHVKAMPCTRVLGAIPVAGVRGVDLSGRELQDFFGGPTSGVWVGLNVKQLRGEAEMGVLGCWGDVDLELS